MIEFIDLKQQYQRYKEEINQAIQRVLNHGHYILGPEVRELEECLAKFSGASYCITAASGTDTLMIALMALGIKPGDEVITTPFTFIAPAEVAALLGAKLVFVDIDPDTYCMDPKQLESVITSKTAAIIPVSLYGQMADLEAIGAIAERHGIPVIEDAAQSFGASHNGKKSCASSLIASTSFYPSKPFGCYGDGGALFTNNEELAAKMRSIRIHGASGKAKYHHTALGFNGRFDTIQAAIMLAKFPHFPEEVKARAAIGERYNQLLKDVCVTPYTAKGNTHTYAQYTIRVPNRDQFAAALEAAGVPTAVHYPRCLHEQPVFSDLNYGKGSFPHAEKASEEVISLPMHPFLTEKQQDLVVNAVKEAL